MPNLARKFLFFSEFLSESPLKQFSFCLRGCLPAKETVGGNLKYARYLAAESLDVLGTELVFREKAVLWVIPRKPGQVRWGCSRDKIGTRVAQVD